MRASVCRSRHPAPHVPRVFSRPTAFRPIRTGSGALAPPAPLQFGATVICAGNRQHRRPHGFRQPLPLGDDLPQVGRQCPFWCPPPRNPLDFTGLCSGFEPLRLYHLETAADPRNGAQANRCGVFFWPRRSSKQRAARPLKKRACGRQAPAGPNSSARTVQGRSNQVRITLLSRTGALPAPPLVRVSVAPVSLDNAYHLPPAS